jgi:hypothetical protein
MNEIGRDIFLREARRSHQIAVSKKWWRLTPDGKADITSRDHGELLMLAISELSEALEVYREGKALNLTWAGEKKKPEGFPIEIADFVIRAFDTILAYDGEEIMCRAVEYFRSTGTLGKDAAISSVPDNVGRALLRITKAAASAEVDGSNYGRMCERLSYAVLEAFMLASKHGIDLWSAIETKAQYNETRPDRHGGKIA